MTVCLDLSLGTVYGRLRSLFPTSSILYLMPGMFCFYRVVKLENIPVHTFKGSIFLKIDILLFRKGLINWYIVLKWSYNVALTACNISVSLLRLNWIKNEICSINSEIRYKITSFQERETNWIFFRLSGATLYDSINTIYINLPNLS